MRFKIENRTLTLKMVLYFVLASAIVIFVLFGIFIVILDALGQDANDRARDTLKKQIIQHMKSYNDINSIVVQNFFEMGFSRLDLLVKVTQDIFELDGNKGYIVPPRNAYQHDQLPDTNLKYNEQTKILYGENIEISFDYGAFLSTVASEEQSEAGLQIMTKCSIYDYYANSFKT